MQASIDFDGTLTGSIAGGGGGGSDVSITPTYQQGVKIADYSIDGNEGAIYTPEIEISKNVLSGVKICEIEGVEIYSPSYGYIDTLGDSNIEQIGGFSQGANVTPVNVKRVSYTNDVSNGEKIGSLTVGDTSFNVYQKASSNIYDGNEKVIGTWFEETLYEKTFTGLATNTNGDNWVNISGIDATTWKDAVNVEIYSNSSDVNNKLTRIALSEARVFNGNVQVTTSAAYNREINVATIQYTKTS